MPEPGPRSHSAQGTVFGFDPENRSGVVLLDDGTELSFDAAAFDGSGLRLLRPGQRVRLQTAHDGSTVLGVQILTIPPT